MTYADTLNWIIKYLNDKQFDEQTFDDIKNSYIAYVKSNEQQIEENHTIEAMLRNCLRRLELDDYITVYHFLDTPTYKLRLKIGMLSLPSYRERTQDEIDSENRAIEYAKDKAREALKERRRQRVINFKNKSWEIFLKYWWTLFVPIISLFLWEIWLKPWVQS